MPRRSQAHNQKIAISASVVEQTHLDHTTTTHLDHHQQLQQLEQQLQQQHQQQLQQQHQQLQQQLQQHQQQLQQQREQLQQEVGHDSEPDEDDEEDEEEDEEEEEGEDDDEDATAGAVSALEAIFPPPIRNNGQVGRNVNLTNSHRKAICQKRLDSPDMTLAELGQWAQQEFSLFRKPAMGTLSRIVNKKEVYSKMKASELSVQRRRAVVCPELDETLLAWIRECQERNIHVSYRMITKKGMELAVFINSLPGKEFVAMPSFSNGWVSGFTKRNGLVGTALNSPAAIQAMPVDEYTASGTFRPFSTNQELLEGVIQARTLEHSADHTEQDDHHMMEHDHGADIHMDSVVSDMHADLHHQVVNAVSGSSSSYPGSRSAVPDTHSPVSASPVKKTRAPRKPRDATATATPRRGKAAKTAEATTATDDAQTAEQQLQQLQRQMHPATPGLNALHQLQQQQQQQFSQSMLQQPSTSLAGSSTNNGLAAAAAAAVAAVTSSEGLPAPTSITRPVPTTSEVMSAIRIVIESLNVNIPAEVELFKPLFDMERRLQNQIHSSDRPPGMMSWSK